MPYPPFHLGPAALIGAPAHPWVDAPTLLVASVIIDLEPGTVVLGLRDGPTHAVVHTFPAATVVAAALAATVWLLRRPGARIASRAGFRWEPRLGAVALAAFIGTESHVLLDAFHHDRMHPFAPFAEGNPLLGVAWDWQIMLWSTTALALGAAIALVRVARTRG